VIHAEPLSKRGERIGKGGLKTGGEGKETKPASGKKEKKKKSSRAQYTLPERRMG